MGRRNPHFPPDPQLQGQGAAPGGTAEGAPGATHASPRPHIRSAHWQACWTGPRKAGFPERKPVLRWIPPIPIGMDWKRELPTNVRMVAE